MRALAPEPLTAEAFAPFGTFTNVLAPQGPALSGELHTFYRDSSRFYCQGDLPIGFSPIAVKKPDKMVIRSVEYHNTTCEAIMAVNDDFILHVSPASGGTPDAAATKVFLVPKGVIVTLYPGVWHLCPLPSSQPVLHALIILPERAYMNDFHIVDFPEEDCFVIEP